MSIQITFKDGDTLDALTLQTLSIANKEGRRLCISITRLPEDTFVFVDIGDLPALALIQKIDSGEVKNG